MIRSPKSAHNWLKRVEDSAVVVSKDNDVEADIAEYIRLGDSGSSNCPRQVSRDYRGRRRIYHETTNKCTREGFHSCNESVDSCAFKNFPGYMPEELFNHLNAYQLIRDLIIIQKGHHRWDNEVPEAIVIMGLYTWYIELLRALPGKRTWHLNISQAPKDNIGCARVFLPLLTLVKIVSSHGTACRSVELASSGDAQRWMGVWAKERIDVGFEKLDHEWNTRIGEFAENFCRVLLSKTAK